MPYLFLVNLRLYSMRLYERHGTNSEGLGCDGLHIYRRGCAESNEEAGDSSLMKNRPSAVI